MIQYELDYLGRIKFLHVKMPYRSPIEGNPRTLDTIVLLCAKGSKDALNLAHMMPRDASLPDSCTPDRGTFYSLHEHNIRHNSVDDIIYNLDNP